jgi:hypothetical protein
MRKCIERQRARSFDMLIKIAKKKDDDDHDDDGRESRRMALFD